MLYFILMLSSFLMVVSLTVALYNIVFSSRIAVIQRLEISTADANTLQEIEEARGKGLKGDLLNVLGVLGKILPNRSNLVNLQKKLIQAQVFMKAEEFLGLTFLTGIGFFILFLLISGNALLSLPLGVIGFKLPDVYVNVKKDKRMKALNNQLPEALSIISSGLRAGFSFPQAMAVVSREMDPPIAEEFGKVIRENALGKTMEDALNNFSERTDNEDIDMFIMALLIQRQVGGNLAEILDNISHTIRERVRIQGEIQTLTAQGRISAIIIVLLPIAVGAILGLMNPTYLLPLIETTIGLVMVVMAVILQITGIFIIRKIIDIDI